MDAWRPTSRPIGCASSPRRVRPRARSSASSSTSTRASSPPRPRGPPRSGPSSTRRRGRIREHTGLTHAERTALEADLERVRERLRNGLDLDGARALAIFASEPAGLFEVLKLPRPVAHKVAHRRRARASSRWPRSAPASCGGSSSCDRKHVRLLAGTVDGLVELWRQEDDVSGQHDQGGWSQARYQRSVEKEVDDHLRSVGAELQRRLRRTRIAGLLLGGPSEHDRALRGAAALRRPSAASRAASTSTSGTPRPTRSSRRPSRRSTS